MCNYRVVDLELYKFGVEQVKQFYYDYFSMMHSTN